MCNLGFSLAFCLFGCFIDISGSGVWTRDTRSFCNLLDLHVTTDPLVPWTTSMTRTSDSAEPLLLWWTYHVNCTWLSGFLFDLEFLSWKRGYRFRKWKQECRFGSWQPQCGSYTLNWVDFLWVLYTESFICWVTGYLIYLSCQSLGAGRHGRLRCPEQTSKKVKAKMTQERKLGK